MNSKILWYIKKTDIIIISTNIEYSNIYYNAIYK